MLKLITFRERFFGVVTTITNMTWSAHIFHHDVISNNFNPDHGIVGPKSIFTIETKTFRKPVKGKANIDFNATTFTVNGYYPERNPITQTQARSS